MSTKKQGNLTPHKSGHQSSSEKVLSVISLFTETKYEWGIDAIAAELGLARTTAYRYAKTLTDAGFLASANAGTYVLGARFIELDRQIRMNDPLLRVAAPMMASLRKEANCLQLLCSYYGESVICIHDDKGDREVHSSWERGRPFPLFRGGTSRVILAYLPSRRLQSLMLNHPVEIARAGLGETWAEFSKTLRQIRHAGFYAAQGEVHPENYGVAAPIMHTEGIAGCLSLARPMASLKKRDIDSMIALTVHTAARISEALQKN
jgi:DNA-binding IclR family transcriptional regulator